MAHCNHHFFFGKGRRNTDEKTEVPRILCITILAGFLVRIFYVNFDY